VNTEIPLILHSNFTIPYPLLATMDCLVRSMKRVFVLTIKVIDQVRDIARGYVEDVETGTEFNFQSSSELLLWLGRTVNHDISPKPEPCPADDPESA
jgi:hypothetical protein